MNFSFGNFVWWIGKVVDIEDEKKLGRVKVRVYGYYDEEIPDEDLPWAVPVSPIQSSSYNKVGFSPTGIQVDATVIGFFMDGETAQVPVIMGTLHGIADKGHDVHPLALGQGGGNKPNYHGLGRGSAYNAKYPHNHVISGENGTIVELDNTKDHERIAFEHPKGTWMEIQPDGTRVNQTAENEYRVVNKDDYILVNGNATIMIGGDVRIEVEGNVSEHVKGNKVTRIDGSYTVHSDGQYTRTTKSSSREASEGNHKITANRIDLN